MSHFEFDGRPVEFREGQSVAAALIGAGIYSWRSTRKLGQPRGMFCGIGVCFDCLIVIDERPNQRACIIPAAPGLRLSSQEGTGWHDLEC